MSYRRGARRGRLWKYWAMTKFLDPLDSAFILLENPGTSMNIGAVVELEAEREDPAERFDDLISAQHRREHSRDSRAHPARRSRAL